MWPWSLLSWWSLWLLCVKPQAGFADDPPALSAAASLDDFRQHGARFTTFGGAVRFPHVRLVGREDVFEVSFALHALRREFGDVELTGPFVFVLDQQPAASAASGPAASGSDEHPGAFELVAVQRELQVTFPQGGAHILGFGRPGALIPQHDDPGAVARGDHSLERAVVDRVILDVHRQALRFGIERRPLRHRP